MNDERREGQILKALWSLDWFRLQQKMLELITKLDPNGLTALPVYPGDGTSARVVEARREYAYACYQRELAEVEARRQLVELDRISDTDDPGVTSEEWGQAWNETLDGLVLYHARQCMAGCGTSSRIHALEALRFWLTKQDNPEGWRNWPQLISWLQS